MKKEAFDVERFFQALGDRTRLRLLNLMGDQEVCVCYFVEILGGPQPKISRHLAYLRSAGIVAARREGKWMHYRISMPAHVGAAQILKQTLGWLKEEKAMQSDRARLTKACCSPSEAHRQSLAVAASTRADEDQAFIDAVSSEDGE
jgi:ArsR family transcriptional regulator, arsenate/arsenite/antimonite-responsive transcriptional repressor